MTTFCSRYQISDMAAAALANGLLKDYYIITRSDKVVEVVDASRIAREKKHVAGTVLNDQEKDMQMANRIRTV